MSDTLQSISGAPPPEGRETGETQQGSRSSSVSGQSGGAAHEPWRRWHNYILAGEPVGKPKIVAYLGYLDEPERSEVAELFLGAREVLQELLTIIREAETRDEGGETTTLPAGTIYDAREMLVGRGIVQLEWRRFGPQEEETP